MTKHSKPFNPYGTFTMPRSLDGFARASTEFVPAVLTCHRGHTHQAGHYFAILIYRDLMWIADDGKVQVHLQDLPHLTPKLASQITQVWAVSLDTFKTPQQVLQGLPPPEEPHYDPPLRASPTKKARLEQGHNMLHFGNVTNMGRQVIDWYWTRDSGIYILAETDLDPQKHQELCQYFTIRGRIAFGTPASPNNDNTGNHAWWPFGPCGSGLWDHGVRCLHHPWLWLPSFPMASYRNHHPGDWPISQDRRDFTTAITTDWAVPWRPHALLKLQFDIEAANKEYRQMPYFPPLPHVPDIDFRPWTTYQSQAYQLELYGNIPNKPARCTSLVICIKPLTGPLRWVSGCCSAS